METAVDKSEDVSSVIESVILKNALQMYASHTITGAIVGVGASHRHAPTHLR